MRVVVHDCTNLDTTLMSADPGLIQWKPIFKVPWGILPCGPVVMPGCNLKATAAFSVCAAPPPFKAKLPAAGLYECLKEGEKLCVQLKDTSRIIGVGAPLTITVHIDNDEGAEAVHRVVVTLCQRFALQAAFDKISDNGILGPRFSRKAGGRKGKRSKHLTVAKGVVMSPAAAGYRAEVDVPMEWRVVVQALPTFSLSKLKHAEVTHMLVVSIRGCDLLGGKASVEIPVALVTALPEDNAPSLSSNGMMRV